MGIEGLSWHMVGFPAWEMFPSAGQHAGRGATGNYAGSGSGMSLFLKVNLVLPSSSLIAKCFFHNWKQDSCGSAAARKHFSAV